MLSGCSNTLRSEFDELCRDAPKRIAQKIEKVSSYVDATGNGCSVACYEDLTAGVVEFVELSFVRSQFEAEKKLNSVWTTCGNWFVQRPSSKARGLPALDTLRSECSSAPKTMP
jgi:hypothetical protein